MRKPVVVAFLLCAFFAPALFAQRSLSWDAVAVEARLDADGRLHVREKQSYVFNGDWNGGERLFRLEAGQDLDFRSLARLDPATGEEVSLERGGLDQVDRYDFTDAKTLRWRSRLPEDPPFRNERMTYVLEYTLSNILVRRGDDYLLDHEFLFADRAGPIDRYTLDLRIDEAWRTDEPHVRRQIDAVADGERALVRIPLVYVGAGSPDARVDRTPARMALLGGIVAMALLSWFLFARREKRLGRFDPLPDVDEAWIETNLLPIRAETIGAAWDGSVQQSEVAALLARLVAEKKMETSTFGDAESPELQMTLKVDRDRFSGYERTLIDEFFFNGNTTDTAAIREHYEGTGLNPASIITPDVTRAANELMGEKTVSEAGGCVGSILVVVFLGVALATTPDERNWAFVTTGVLFVLFLIASGVAAFWQRRSDFGRRQALWMFLPWALMLGAIAVLTRGELPLLPELLFGAAAAAAIATTAVVASSKHRRKAIEFRRKLAAVREYFKKELASPAPRLDDAWFPYVLAFGLGEAAESWFKSFGGASSGAGAIAHSSSSSSSGGGSSWTGGGGAFGGAGASGMWVAAATGVAAGVASPSSSSSSGGGGGGGSSGGGGGGGW